MNKNEKSIEAMNFFIYTDSYHKKMGSCIQYFSNWATASQCDKHLMKSNISLKCFQITTRKIHRNTVMLQ